MVRTASSSSSSSSDKLKDQWDEEDDAKILTYTSKSQEMPVQRRNAGKGSRERWSCGNRDLDAKHNSFTPQEEELVIQLHAAIGSRWPIIAQQLPGRTENDVKTLWNSKLRKKLSAMGIDPVTHKPFSQILADYGSIGAFPKARTRFASLSRDLKNATILRSQLTSSNSPPDAKLEVSTLDQSHSSLNLFSQLQAVNLVGTDMENEQECGPSSSSDFSWSDFLLEDELLLVPPPQDSSVVKGGIVDGIEEKINGEEGSEKMNKFEGGSCLDNSSFVEAMLESQDEMFAQLSGFFGEPFYY